MVGRRRSAPGYFANGGFATRGNDRLLSESAVNELEMLSPETILQGRYRIARQLGQGGMGAVYEATDQRLDTIVALKETLFTDEKLRKQFEREARLLARMHHQALPRVSDHFTEGEGAFLVMQFIPGEDLFEMQTRSKGPFSPDDVLRWADQLCDALDYLHTQDPQIIHRDIKPQNLKLTARGQIILLDFGLAKGSGGQFSVVTTSASIFGYTPNYAPLEQVQGLGTDPRSDIYALAATLYHLLTNVKPPDALSRAASLVNGMPDPLTPADAVSAQVSRAVALVLEKGMSQKRDDRYASAEEMRAALRNAATQPAGEAATVLTSAGVVAGSNTVVPAGGTQVAGQQTNAAGNEAQTLLADEDTKVRSQTAAATMARPVSAPGRTRMWLAAAGLAVVLAGIAGAVYIYRARQSQAAEGAAPAVQNPATSTDATLSASPATDTSNQAGATEPKSNSKADTGNQRTRPTETPKPAPVRSGERDTATQSDRNRNPPDPPPSDPLPNPERQRPQVPRDPPPVRTFPNGTRVETRPDGTRIVTMPDGRTRVFPPGANPNRPNPNRRRRIPD